MAESPPPTTAMGWPLKKKPSHVAHVERPWPMRRVSASRPSISERAPVAAITDRVRYSSSPTQTPNGDDFNSTAVTLAVRKSAPKRSACARNDIISSGPRTPSTKPG